MKDYNLEELKQGIDSNNIRWDERSNYPMGFEFSALVRMAHILHMTDPNKTAFEAQFPKGFIVKMKHSNYSSLEIIPKA
jgi:hypothetical protein